MPAVRVAGACVLLALGAACSKKASPAQCEQLVDHYAEVVVRAASPNASAESHAVARARERDDARNDDLFRNCTSEILAADYACAMSATTAASLEKCLQ